MAKVKGKFIKLTGNLMLAAEIQEANKYLVNELGLTHLQLKDEEWYDTKIFDRFMSICAENSLAKDGIYLMIGKRVYPVIQRTVGLPPHLKTPLDFVLFEAEGFLLNHQGEDVVPRKIMKSEEGEVVIEAKAPGYNSKLYEGVFLGILEMCGKKETAKVENLGDDVFKITW